MIKNILWDFDGVILDSMKIKGDGFVELFSAYPQEKTNRLYDYHFKNGGVSRFEKIRYFYENILNESIDEKKVDRLADKFGQIVSQKLCNEENLIEDSFEFIKKNHQKFNFHIVSGAEEMELRFLCEKLGLTPYFKSIDGSPVPKAILVERVLKTNSYNKEETILIGDALTDLNAAKLNDIAFYAYNNPSLKKYLYIESFKETVFG